MKDETIKKKFDKGLISEFNMAAFDLERIDIVIRAIIDQILRASRGIFVPTLVSLLSSLEIFCIHLYPLMPEEDKKMWDKIFVLLRKRVYSEEGIVNGFITLEMLTRTFKTLMLERQRRGLGPHSKPIRDAPGDKFLVK